MAFIPHFVDMMYHIDFFFFTDNEPALYPWYHTT